VTETPLLQLPLVPVRDTVLFPKMVAPLVLGRPRSVKALEAAMAGDRRVFVVLQRRASVEDPAREHLHEVGVEAEVLQWLRAPDGNVRALVEGKRRALLMDAHEAEGGFLRVDVQPQDAPQALTADMHALSRQAHALFDQYLRVGRRLPAEIMTSLPTVEQAAELADAIAAHLPVRTEEKQQLLEIADVKRRLERLCEVLFGEIDLLSLEKRIHSRVRGQIEKSQREYYLQEQMKAIQKELKKGDGNDLDDLKKKIADAKLPEEAKEAADRELARLEKMMPMSPEGTVSRTYLEWLAALPWNAVTKDDLDLKKAQEILDEDHFGLEKAKERIVEYLAVLKLTKALKGPILCFVGPPGVGKTSLAKGIARALGRKFQRIALGGVRDEAEIRGHRRTYIGSLPGRIMQALKKAKTKNPVILLDEIDKLGNDWRGDPASALLEVLDPEQNHVFTDHYLDLGFDLSQTLFITTANTLYTIPSALQDRLEVLRFPGYTTEEKLSIATTFLLPKQMKDHGLPKTFLKITPDALRMIIRDYTQEAGVRQLDREIAALCRKTARRLVGDKAKSVSVAAADLHKLLGPAKVTKEKSASNAVGVATGLAWTEHGGETLSVEVMLLPGKGKIILTGKMGDVMRESAQAAFTYVRSQAGELKIKGQDLLKDRDLHIHIPEGAVPKDGPSAGIALATAVASALTGRAVKKDLAMTGEITLQGRVLPIGGLKEKVLAAHREGVHTVLFPRANQKDLEEIPEDVRKALKLVPVASMAEVLDRALEQRRQKS
jgi:ATP-dependent Lon protease